MTPSAAIIIGLLIYAIGHIEQVRDGKTTLSAGFAHLLGFAILLVGWIWLLRGWLR